MWIKNFRHKGLKNLYQEGDRSGLPSASVDKVRRVLAALENADTLEQVLTFPGWRLHPLKGARKGQFSMTITANWRITFRVEGNTLQDLDFEDYH